MFLVTQAHLALTSESYAGCALLEGMTSNKIPHPLVHPSASALLHRTRRVQGKGGGGGWMLPFSVATECAEEHWPAALLNEVAQPVSQFMVPARV